MTLTGAPANTGSSIVVSPPVADVRSLHLISVVAVAHVERADTIAEYPAVSLIVALPDVGGVNVYTTSGAEPPPQALP